MSIYLKDFIFYKICKVGLLTYFAICLILDSQRDGSAQGVCELQKTLRIIVGRSRLWGAVSAAMTPKNASTPHIKSPQKVRFAQ